ncbi:MAG: hypothetical protein LBV61_02590 [Burkholderiaceae bacterium]|jgi:hypothetical protein|nr:hypothetical protein [Burkholderiaceae bacterium]
MSHPSRYLRAIGRAVALAAGIAPVLFLATQTALAAQTVKTVRTTQVAQAASTPIWRCGSRYSDQPCEGGHILQAGDPREAQQQREASENARRNAAQARALESARHTLEARAAKTPAVMAVAAGAPQPKIQVQPDDKKPLRGQRQQGQQRQQRKGMRSRKASAGFTAVSRPVAR